MSTRFKVQDSDCGWPRARGVVMQCSEARPPPGPVPVHGGQLQPGGGGQAQALQGPEETRHLQHVRTPPTLITGLHKHTQNR